MTYSQTCVALSITFPLLAILATAGRFSCRRKIHARVQADDWLIVLGLICAIGVGICGLVGTFKGDLGVSQPKGPSGFAIVSPKIVTFKKVLYASSLIFTASMTFTKLSVLLFYRRVFSQSNFKWPFYIAFGLNLLWGVGFFFTYTFQCIPVSQVWQTLVGQKRNCWDPSENYYFAISSVILDLIVLALPVPIVVRLQMPKRRKFAILGIFFLGFIVVAIGIAKTVEFFNLTAKIMKNHDPTSDNAGVFYWTIPECSISVVGACLPTMRPMFQGWSPESIVNSIRSAITLRSLRSHSRETLDTERLAREAKNSQELESHPNSLHKGAAGASYEFPRSNIGGSSKQATYRNNLEV